MPPPIVTFGSRTHNRDTCWLRYFSLILGCLAGFHLRNFRSSFRVFSNCQSFFFSFFGRLGLVWFVSVWLVGGGANYFAVFMDALYLVNDFDVDNFNRKQSGGESMR